MKLCEDQVFLLLSKLLQPNPPGANIYVATAAAYLVGCLMSGNVQGQNMAREKKVVHGLIGLFK